MARIRRADVPRGVSPASVLLLHGSAAPSRLAAEFVLQVGGEYTLEVLKIFDNFTRDARTTCVRDARQPVLLARHLILGQNTPKCASWVSPQRFTDPTDPKHLTFSPAWTRIQQCDAKRKTFAELAADPLPTTHLTTRSNTFQYEWSRIHNWQRTRVKPALRFLPGVCVVGGSHARNLCAVLRNCTWVRTTLVGHPMVPPPSCSAVVYHYGQWDLSRSGAGAHPMQATLFADIERGLSARMAEAPKGRSWVLSCNHIPLNCDITTCPPTDWRSPPMVDEFNEVAERLASAHSVPFIDNTDIVSPMWDAAPDWKHPHGPVLDAIANRLWKRLCRRRSAECVAL